MKALRIRLYEDNPNPKQVGQVVECLKQGGLIIYPTDTVYALGCDSQNAKALQQLAKLKGVSLEKAYFSFVCADLSDLSVYAKQLDGATFRILKRALPGPYTFILPSAMALPAPFNKKKTVGIRVPENNIARALAATLGRPIATASLHDQDEIIDYTTDPDSIFEDWNLKVSAIVDAGMGGLVPSTVIDLSQDEPLVMREGLGDVGVI